MNRKKPLHFLLIASVGLLVLGLAGCSLFAEFEGTWVYSSAGQTVSWTFSKTLSELAYYGTPVNGTISYSVVAYDESADHIQLSVTGSTGDCAGAPLGQQNYIFYSISGNQMFIGGSTSGYPATTSIGPFIKQ